MSSNSRNIGSRSHYDDSNDNSEILNTNASKSRAVVDRSRNHNDSELNNQGGNLSSYDRNRDSKAKHSENVNESSSYSNVDSNFDYNNSTLDSNRIDKNISNNHSNSNVQSNFVSNAESSSSDIRQGSIVHVINCRYDNNINNSGVFLPKFAFQFYPKVFHSKIWSFDNIEFSFVKISNNNLRFDKIYNKKDCLAVIPLHLWQQDSITQAFSIAYQCQQLGAIGVIIALPDPIDYNMFKMIYSLIFGNSVDFPINQSKSNDIKKFRFEIPLYGVNTSFTSTLIRHTIGKFEVTEVIKSYKNGIEQSIVKATNYLIGEVPLKDSNIDELESLLNENKNNKPDKTIVEKFYKHIITLADANTFPIAIEMMEIMNNSSLVDYKVYKSYLLETISKYDMTWTDSAVRSAKSKQKFQNRVLTLLENNTLNLDQSVMLWAFLSKIRNNGWEHMVKIISNQSTDISTNLESFAERLEKLNKIKVGFETTLTIENCNYLIKNTPKSVQFPLSYLLLIQFIKVSETKELINILVNKIISSSNSLAYLNDAYSMANKLPAACQDYYKSKLDENLHVVIKKFSIYDQNTFIIQTNKQINKNTLDGIVKDIKNILSLDTLNLLNTIDEKFQGQVNILEKLLLILNQKNNISIQNSISLKFSQLLNYTNHPIIRKYHEPVLQFLKSLSFDFTFKTRRNEYFNFAKLLSNINDCGDFNKKIVDEFIINGMQQMSAFDQNEGNIFDILDSFRTASLLQKYFIESSLNYCIVLFKVEDVFSSYQNLLKFLRSVNEQCLFFYLITSIGSNNSFDHVKALFLNLFYNLDSAIITEFDDLIKLTATIQIIERAFKINVSNIIPQRANQWSIDVKLDYIKKQIPFIELLKKYFPNIISTLEQETFQLCNCNVLQDMVIRNFLIKYQTIDEFVKKFNPEVKKFYIYFSSLSENITLFKHYLSEKIPLTYDELVEHISFVEMKLRSVVRSQLNMNELVEINILMSGSARRSENELKSINEYYYDNGGDDIVDIVETIGKILVLLSNRQFIVDLILGTSAIRSVFELLNLNFESDSAFEKLKDETKSLISPDHLMSLEVNSCVKFIDAIVECFQDFTSLHEVFGFLVLLKNIGEADKVFDFFLTRKDFVSYSETNPGCSDLFNSTVDDFNEELNKEDSNILVNFRSSAFWVCLIIPAYGKSFSELCQRFHNPRFLSEVKSNPTDFGQLKFSQSNIDYINQLFNNGIAGLDAVLPQYEMIKSNATFIFVLSSRELKISYFDLNRKVTKEMLAEEVQEFELRLEFIQHEEKAEGRKVSDFIRRLAIYRKGLAIMTTLNENGHQKFSKDILVDINEHSSNESLMKWLDDLKILLFQWEQSLNQARINDKILCLFTIPQVRRLATLIRKRTVNGLYYSIAHLFVDKQSKSLVFYKNLNETIEYLFNKYIVVEISWLELLQIFFKELTKRIKLNVVAAPDSFVISANVRYIISDNGISVEKTLCHIFGMCRPNSFQLLWCNNKLTISDISNFMYRAKYYPTLKFVAVNFHKLNQDCQYLFLKSILEDKSIMNISFVDKENSVLKTASWFPIVYPDELPDISLLNFFENWYKLTETVIDKNQYKSYQGPSGSGKSFQIKKLMKNAESFTVLSITENFDHKKILQKLINYLEENISKNVLLVFQINIGVMSNKMQFLELMNEIDNFMFQLIVLRSVVISNTDIILDIPWGTNWTVALELPNLKDNFIDDSISVRTLLPIVSEIFKIFDADAMSFEIDEMAKHVCKYLQAYESGLIDELYSNSDRRDIVFVLDRSGSMGENNRLDICKSSISKIIDLNLRYDDNVGLVLFDDLFNIFDLKNLDDNHRMFLKNSIQQAYPRNGTHLWGALKKAIDILTAAEQNSNKIIVALTDGEATDINMSSHVSNALQSSGKNIQIIFITVNLAEKHRNFIKNTCLWDQRNLESVNKNIMFDAEDTSLAQIWNNVADALTLTEKILVKGEKISDDNCRELLRRYMKLDTTNSSWSRTEQVFWIRYIYRRLGILAQSDRFNKNVTEHYGSLTMEVILNEAERVLSINQIDWNKSRHEQMIFKKSKKSNGENDFTWSILCTKPDDDDPDWINRKDKLRLLKLCVPSNEDLNRADRRVLDSYLANGLGIELNDIQSEQSSSGQDFDFNLGSLPVLENNQFVLTVDFTIKLLTIYERIECGINCILQGETGVSKTKLTSMLFTLINKDFKESPLFNDFRIDSSDYKSCTFDIRRLNGLRYLANYWNLIDHENILNAWNDIDLLSEQIYLSRENLLEDIYDELRSNPSYDPLEKFTINFIKNPKNSPSLLLWLVETMLNYEFREYHWTFFPVNVHASMSIKDIEAVVKRVANRAEHATLLGELLKSQIHINAKLCIFFDEFNTSSHMGTMKEIMSDHTINGDKIPSNIVILGACNPARERISYFSDRKQEHGLEWVSGHYQVQSLPQSLKTVLWDYGSLTAPQEKEFIRKLLILSNKWSELEIQDFTDLIYFAQEKTRELAEQHVQYLIKDNGLLVNIGEVRARASSSLSLRDILRCFKIFKFLSAAPKEVKEVFLSGRGDLSEDKANWLLSIGIVYYLRLSVDKFNTERNFRMKFDMSVESILSSAMESLINQTELENGIARTRGLQENIFVTVVCLMAKIPTMIVGPPGSSKTLALDIITSNARGLYSKTNFYKSISKMISFHYQCSRRSTSKQIEDVFERAIKRQFKANEEAEPTCCFVFMDEAGLPEEAKESLKVLHYYLENYLKVLAEVGFVAISNHVLDAAKTNRCILLTRNPPDSAELLQITEGCFGDISNIHLFTCKVSTVDPSGIRRDLAISSNFSHNKSNGLFELLSETFEACISEKDHPKLKNILKVTNFIEFYGLRDYMNFISLLGRLVWKNSLLVNLDLIKDAVERNFSGSNRSMVKEVISFFVSSFIVDDKYNILLSNPIELLIKSLLDQYYSTEPCGRYIMIIDTTCSDGIMRFLHKHVLGRIRHWRTLKLSDFPEDTNAQQINIISQTRFAMERGDAVILSSSEATNESFYDLFNQHFRKSTERNQDSKETIVYRTNIAIGADSRRCRVNPSFQCIMHLNLRELEISPAPLLNRFEKYRVTMSDALEYILKYHPYRNVIRIDTIISNVLQHVNIFINSVRGHSFIGYSEKHLVKSVLIQILENKLISEKAIFHYLYSELNNFKFVYDSTIISIKLSPYETSQLYDAADQFTLLNDYIINPSNERRRDIGVSLISQVVLQDVMNFLIDISIPECLLIKASNLPSNLINLVLEQRKFVFDWNYSKNIKNIAFTRSTTNLLKAQIQNQDNTNMIILSQCSNESQFTEFMINSLSESNKHNHFIVMIDLSLVTTTMINFVKYKVDMLMSDYYKTENIVRKSVTLLIHSLNIDLRSHLRYDVIDDSDWYHYFIDSFDVHSNLAWLELGYQSIEFPKAYSFLRSIGENWYSDVANVIAERLVIGAKCNVNSKMICYTLNYDNNSIKNILIEKFCNYWLGHTVIGNTNFEKIKFEIQSLVQKYAISSFNVSLIQYIDSEIYNMYLKFIVYYIGLLLEDISLTDLPKQDLLLLKIGIDGCDIPEQGSLSTPIKRLYGQSLIGKSFPFFHRIHQFLELEVSKIILLHEDDVNDERYYEIMVTELLEYFKTNESLECNLIFYITENEEKYWSQFLDKFVSFKFSNSNEQSQMFVIQWLDKNVLKIPHLNKFALLYFISHVNKDITEIFVDFMNNFYSHETSVDKMNKIIDELDKIDDYDIDYVFEFLKLQVIDVYYDSLKSQSTLDGFQSWNNLAKNLILNIVIDSNSDIQNHVNIMNTMISVLSLAPYKYWTIDNISMFFKSVKDKMNEDQSSGIMSIALTSFKNTISNDIDLDFFSYLIRYIGKSLTNTDINWIFENVVVRSQKIESFQWSPILDVLLFDIVDSNSKSIIVPNNISELFDKMSNKGILDHLIASQTLGNDYTPDFIRDDINSSFPYLADVSFHVIWKWLHTFSSRHNSIEYINSLRINCEEYNKNRAKNIRKIALVAVDIMILIHWIRDLSNQISYEDNTINDVLIPLLRRLGGINPTSVWIKFIQCLFRNINKNLSFSAINDLINDWKNKNCNNGRILSAWMYKLSISEELHMPNDVRAINQLLVYKDLNFNKDPILKIIQDNCNSAVLRNFQLFQTTWVVPYILEFYSWLTDELTDYNLSFDNVKALTISQILANCHFKSKEFYQNYSKLWTKVKTGIYSYESLSGLRYNIDDSTRILDLLSTEDMHTVVTNNGLLIKIASDMLEIVKTSIFGLEIDDEASSDIYIRKFTQSQKENFERLTTISIKSIDLIIYNLSTEKYKLEFPKELDIKMKSVENYGIFQRLAWNAITNNSEVLINIEEILLKNLIPNLRHMKINPIYCSFISDQTYIDSFGLNFDAFFHSLEYADIKQLLNSLQFYATLYSGDSKNSLLVVLNSIHGSDNLHDNINKIFKNLDQNQKEYILSLSYEFLPNLINYFTLQLQSELYLFARKPINLKKDWSFDVEERFNNVADFSNREFNMNVLSLETLLIEHENLIAANSEHSLVSTLSSVYKSEEDLLNQFPLLSDFSSVCSSIANSFTLLCGHYVHLRLKLKKWKTSVIFKRQDIIWDWPIKKSACRIDTIIQDRSIEFHAPWFLREGVSKESFKSEVEINYDKLRNKAAVYIQNKFRKYLSEKLNRKLTSYQEISLSKPKGPPRGLKNSTHRNKNTQNLNFADQLEKLLKENNRMKLSFINKLKSIIQIEGITDDIAMTFNIQKAQELVKVFNSKLDNTVMEINSIKMTFPVDTAKLYKKIEELDDMEATSLPEYRQAKNSIKYCNKIEFIKSEYSNFGYHPSLIDLQQICIKANNLNLAIDPIILSLKNELEKDNVILKDGLRNLLVDETLVEFIMNLCINFPSAHDDPLLINATTTEKQKEILYQYINNIDCNSVVQLGNLLDSLREDLEIKPLHNWIHSTVVLAIISTMPTQLEFYGGEAVSYVKRYIESIRSENKQLKIPSLIMLVFARNDSTYNKLFRRACLRKVYGLKTKPWLIDQELLLLKDSNDNQEYTSHDETYHLLKRWQEIKDPTLPCSAIDEIFRLIGQSSIKSAVLDFYEEVLSEKEVPSDSRIPRAFNFVLLGKPGTGKTTLAKLLGKLLNELSIRNTSNFVESTGGKLIQTGSKNALSEFNKAINGVLFIDEAYQLSPESNNIGREIADLLLDYSESRRDDLTIILAGYKDDIEQKLFDFNIGFKSRFSFVWTFEDYSDNELGLIFKVMCDDKKWTFEPEVIRAVSRRIGRGRSKKNFGNARAVRIQFQQAYSRAIKRKNNGQRFIISDILGPRPDINKIPDLNDAINELDATVGLNGVKRIIKDMICNARNNYDKEMRGEDPDYITLNKVFFGNPGTGKTTIAKLYGRILKGLGLLSDGQCETKLPKDFIGSFVGETQQKTSNLIERCAGKVLIIDEAYGFLESSFGIEAINTLVGLIHNEPGEDIAVIMIGYENNMRQMFNDPKINIGLARRFSLDNPVIFADYNDSELKKLTMKILNNRNRRISSDVLNSFIKLLSNQRNLPNFGNAGTVTSMVTNAIANANTRNNSKSNEVILEDFGLSSTRKDPIQDLKGKFKMDHIVEELQKLSAVIKQCERDKKDPKEYLKNYIFIGNAGTGKTTVARSMAEMLHDLGLLANNKVIIKSGLDLQGSYLGQTKDKVNQAMTEAQGGVLFIDEAYSLGSSSLFSKEAVDQLVALMTDPMHYRRTVVIFAGYPIAMQEMMRSNQGLVSRCEGQINFPDWDENDCVSYIIQYINKSDQTIDNDSVEFLRKGLKIISSRPNWANARDCGTTLNLLYESRARRQSESNNYTLQDAKYAIEALLSKRPVLVGKSYEYDDSQFGIGDNFDQDCRSNTKSDTIVNNSIVNPSLLKVTKLPNNNADRELNKKDVKLDDNPVFVALLEACREAGYDNSHDKRKELINILLAVHSGGNFPDEISTIIERKTTEPIEKAMPLLKDQINLIIEGMSNAVNSEEHRLKEFSKLQENDQIVKEQERHRQLEKLNHLSLCPMGYSWHRHSTGWLCAGGSHFVSDDQLNG